VKNIKKKNNLSFYAPPIEYHIRTVGGDDHALT
jgi:hypothetical protein